MKNNISNTFQHIYSRTLKASKMTLIGTASVAALSLSLPVVAQEYTERVSIEAQALDLAILSLSRQTGVTILVGGDVAKGKFATELKGNYTPRDALQHLLLGSGLTLRLNDDGTYVVIKKDGVQKISYNTMADYQENLAVTEDVVGAEEEGIEEVIITGSRLGRSEFSSASPIQVISGQKSREMGIFDPSEMLQRNNVSTGTQIDNSFAGFVLDNGPGSATADFRGIGAGRTLVMVNGRRMAPAGVGGAPVAADLNLVPSIMIDRIEALLDGASTVYGSDAIAGVANIILKKDFEGLEIEGSGTQTESGGGETYNVGAMWGKTFDRGFISIAGEYYERKKLTYAQNRLTKDCNDYYYEYENGSIVPNGRLDLAPGTTETTCKLDTTNRIWVVNSAWGNVWATPGESNIGVPGLSETTFPDWGAYYLSGGYSTYDENHDGIIYNQYLHPCPVSMVGGGCPTESDSIFFDKDGDGVADVDIQNPYYNAGRSDYIRQGDFVSGMKRWSVVANGEYNLEDSTNSTLYFEGLFSKRQNKIYSPDAFIFPNVPGKDNPEKGILANPYNLCVSSPGGCYQTFGIPGYLFDNEPTIHVKGDRDYQDVSVYQYRAVLGIRGEIPALAAKDWTYDVYGAYSRSKGKEAVQGINEAHLNLSLTTTREDPDNPGSYICGSGSDGCVVVNMFAPSLYQEGAGEFATQAEKDYLYINRLFETKVEEIMVSGFLKGDTFNLPWNDNPVPLAVGYEFRKDTIDSTGNDAATQGLLAFYFSDQGARGSSNLHEFFAETRFDLIQGKPMVEELSVTASARYTKHNLYDGAWTYSFNGIYRPTDWLMFRGTYGTSYRAPNLRENFLLATTGYNTVTDPCVVPSAARVSGGPGAPETYDATKDTRVGEGQIFDACRAHGLDPETLGLNSDESESGSEEISNGGNSKLNEERSRAYTYGFVLEQPWSEAFDLSLSVTYFDIKVTGSISEPGAQYTVDQCYNNAESATPGTSIFCDKVQRNADGFITLIHDDFINIGKITSKGMDLNALFEKDFEVASKNLEMTVDLRATYTKESLTEIAGDVDDDAGETEAPRWRASGLLSLKYDDFGLNWSTRWIQGGEEDDLGEFDNYSVCPVGPVCRARGAATNNYDVHSLSFVWTPSEFGDGLQVVAGINNVFDKMPEKVDGDALFSTRNFPLGIGYDYFGRSFHLSVKKTF